MKERLRGELPSQDLQRHREGAEGQEACGGGQNYLPLQPQPRDNLRGLPPLIWKLFFPNLRVLDRNTASALQ